MADGAIRGWCIGWPNDGFLPSPWVRSRFVQRSLKVRSRFGNRPKTGEEGRETSKADNEQNAKKKTRAKTQRCAPEVGGWRTEIRGRRSEVRDRRTEVGGKRSTMRNLACASDFDSEPRSRFGLRWASRVGIQLPPLLARMRNTHNFGGIQ